MLRGPRSSRTIIRLKRPAVCACPAEDEARGLRNRLECRDPPSPRRSLRAATSRDVPRSPAFLVSPVFTPMHPRAALCAAVIVPATSPPFALHSSTSSSAAYFYPPRVSHPPRATLSHSFSLSLSYFLFFPLSRAKLCICSWRGSKTACRFARMHVSLYLRAAFNSRR